MSEAFLLQDGVSSKIPEASNPWSKLGGVKSEFGEKHCTRKYMECLETAGGGGRCPRIRSAIRPIPSIIDGSIFGVLPNSRIQLVQQFETKVEIAFRNQQWFLNVWLTTTNESNRIAFLITLNMIHPPPSLMQALFVGFCQPKKSQARDSNLLASWKHLKLLEHLPHTIYIYIYM